MQGIIGHILVVYLGLRIVDRRNDHIKRVAGVVGILRVIKLRVGRVVGFHQREPLRNIGKRCTKRGHRGGIPIRKGDRHKLVVPFQQGLYHRLPHGLYRKHRAGKQRQRRGQSNQEPLDRQPSILPIRLTVGSMDQRIHPAQKRIGCLHLAQRRFGAGHLGQGAVLRFGNDHGDQGIRGNTELVILHGLSLQSGHLAGHLSIIRSIPQKSFTDNGNCRRKSACACGGGEHPRPAHRPGPAPHRRQYAGQKRRQPEINSAAAYKLRRIFSL